MMTGVAVLLGAQGFPGERGCEERVCGEGVWRGGRGQREQNQNKDTDENIRKKLDQKEYPCNRVNLFCLLNQIENNTQHLRNAKGWFLFEINYELAFMYNEETQKT